MANEYLKRTPTSTGNRKVFTWAGWIKRNGQSSQQRFFSSGADGDYVPGGIAFGISLDNGEIQLFAGNTGTDRVNTSVLYRDSSSWMHICVVVDTTSYVQEDRFKLYVNGVLYQGTYDNASPNWPSINYEYASNMAGKNQALGATSNSSPSAYFTGQFTDVFLVDGQALTPDIFGFYKDGNGYISAGSTQATDFRPGQWVPKSPRIIKSEINRRGGFGVNGFYLPMNSSNNFGADFHTTPNTILKLKENLPQPKAEIDGSGDYTNALRDDPFKQYLVLAIPFVSGGLQNGFGDYSAAIRDSGSPKTIGIIGGVSINHVSDGTSASVYYGSSGSFNGTNSGVSVSNISQFTGDFTIEMWIYPKVSGFPSGGNLFGDYGSGQTTTGVQFAYYNNGLFLYANGGYIILPSATTGKVPSNQWSHVAVSRKSNIVLIYVNGVAIATANSSATYGVSNSLKYIGIDYPGTGEPFNGFIQDVRVYSGVAKYKGGFDCPKPYTPVGIATWRAVLDTTANNFAIMNSLYLFGNANTSWVSNITLSDGNLSASWTNGTGSNQHTRSSIAMLSGKWYFEGKLNSTSGGDFGIAFENHINDSVGYGSDQKGFSYRTDGQKQNSTSAIAYGSTYGTSDIIGVAYDADAGEITFYKNGVSQGIAFSGISIDEPAYFGCGKASSSTTQTASFNFGQNPTFSGNTTAGTYTDSNGKGLFKYQPPSGFLALCEDNLPTPAIADPGKYFKTVLYTGDGNNGRSITGLGFKPDFVWIKRRASGNQAHALHDSVRGPSIHLETSTTDGDETNNIYGALNSFDTDGFSLSLGSGGGGDYVNSDNNTYVAWCWKAGGEAVTNTDGSITSQVSVNQDAGFSIVSYTGTATAGTVGHGLGKTPSFLIVKNRDDSTNWFIRHSGYDVGGNSRLVFDTSAGSQQDNPWNNSYWNATTFPVGDQNWTNGSSDNMIAYCWTEIEGFSKFGKYVANGNADGAFVYLGFKPAWVMIKCSNVSNSVCTSGGYNSWGIYDSSRDSSNPAGDSNMLWANRSYAEGLRGDGSADSSYFKVDLLSNGFKIRGGANCENNSNGATYIFAAFAESPFTTANAK